MCLSYLNVAELPVYCRISLLNLFYPSRGHAAGVNVPKWRLMGGLVCCIGLTCLGNSRGLAITEITRPLLGYTKTFSLGVKEASWCAREIYITKMGI
jgi:hypothetical protein